MYVRQQDGEELDFIVSGKLWRDALVMLDRQTGTHWSQISGEAFQGELARAVLTVFPSEMTTWKAWREAYPETRVLRKDPPQIQKESRYASYFAEPTRLGIFGRAIDDDRLDPKEIVVAVEVGGESVVIPEAKLPRDRVVQLQVGDVPAVIVPTRGGGTVAYDRRVNGRVVDFELVGDSLISDDGAWDARTGAPRGTNAGQLSPLGSLRAHVVFWFGWVSFFPDAQIWPGE